MSCDRRCSDPNSCWHDFEDCAKCPGADKFRPMAKEYQTFEKPVCLIENGVETPAGEAFFQSRGL